MSTEISWVFETAVKPDALDEYSAVAREISADNQAAEPGQQIFEWFLDGQDIHIYERYQDSDAALAHVQRFVDNFASGFLSLCTPTRMSVYGEPSESMSFPRARPGSQASHQPRQSQAVRSGMPQRESLVGVTAALAVAAAVLLAGGFATIRRLTV